MFKQGTTQIVLDTGPLGLELVYNYNKDKDIDLNLIFCLYIESGEQRICWFRWRCKWKGE